MSLRTRLILASIGLIAYTCLVLGATAAWFAARTVEREAMRAVGIAADGRRVALVERLAGVVDRNAAFLVSVRETCGADAACAERRLREHADIVELRAARLDLQGLAPIRAGARDPAVDAALGAAPPLARGQLAEVIRIDGTPALAVRLDTSDGDRLTLLPDMRPVVRIFAERAGLGEAGETFLSDAAGFFVTPSRYASNGGHSHPIAARPMLACLAGRDGEVVDPDYRDVVVIHGFRHVPEIGGGCIMAHIDRDEAYAPVDRLLARLGGATLLIGLSAALLAARLADTLTRPIENLTARANALDAGHLDAPFTPGGPPEIQALGQAFSGMAARLSAIIEDLRRSNHDLEAFTYSVSHDLRAPLRAMDGYAGIVLEEYALPPEATGYLERIRGNATRMAQLIDDLLALSRAGRKQLEAASVSMMALVREVLDELGEGRVDPRVQLSLGELPDAWGDRALLKQVLANLIGNALKYSRTRDPAVIEIGWSDGAYFVRDNGVGFESKYAEKAFEVFERLHADETFEGTGIGLAIARRIIERHGGRIWAEAELDRGATVRFTLG
ncbi:MAG: ATP-binding protein [Pseudomonadota bacterium]|nr:ATP-binding protein [Pseudomonadota bacterium]